MNPINTKGKLIFVTGLFGAGKTTLTTAAVEAIPHLQFIQTYTTRPQRVGEVHGKGEYFFVNEEEYFKRKSQSSNWDHSVVDNFYYGNDIGEINERLIKGDNFILCVAPDVEMLDRTKSKYKISPLLIWIDTDIQVSNKRLVQENRAHRINSPMQTVERGDEIKKISDIVFITSEDIEVNKKGFIELLEGLITIY